MNYPRHPDIEVRHLRNPSEICLLFWDDKDCYRKHHVEITDFIDSTTCVPEEDS